MLHWKPEFPVIDVNFTLGDKTFFIVCLFFVCFVFFVLGWQFVIVLFLVFGVFFILDGVRGISIYRQKMVKWI